MQEPFPALTHLRLDSLAIVVSQVPPLPDTFLAGSAPRLQKISMGGFAFPAAPTLLLSAHDLVDVDLHDIPSAGYVPPEVMVASLATLPRLKNLTFGFDWGVSYPDQLPLPPITRTVLPALTKFYFRGRLDYFENLVAQIDAPQIVRFKIWYQDQREDPDFQIPQLCKFIDRSETLKLSRSGRVVLSFDDDDGAAISLFRQHQLLFTLSIRDDAIGQVVSQISAILSSVDCLSIRQDWGEPVELDRNIPWLELFRPFTTVTTLIVGKAVSFHIPLALNNVAEETAGEVLPALELLCLECEPVASLEPFLAARQNVGRPVTFVSEKREF